MGDLILIGKKHACDYCGLEYWKSPLGVGGYNPTICPECFRAETDALLALEDEND